MKNFGLATLIFLVSVAVSAAPPAIPPPAPTVISRDIRTPVPVCGGGQLPSDGGLNQAGYPVNFHRMYWCPRGATSIQLMFSGVWANGAGGELYLSTSIPINLGIAYGPNMPTPWCGTGASAACPGGSSPTYAVGRAVVWGQWLWTSLVSNTNSMPYAGNSNWSQCAAWNSGTTYVAGQCVYSGSPQSAYVAAAGSTNSTPGLGNANWTVLVSYQPVTCNGQRACGVPLLSTPAGAAVSQGFILTDPISVNVPVGGWITVNAATAQQGQIAYGIPTVPAKGEYNQAFPGSPDYSLAAGQNPSNVLWEVGYSPTAIIGQPVQSGPTVCLIGDSIMTGAAGSGFQTPGTLTSGGSGFTSADVGSVVVIPNTNASSTALTQASTLYQITGVTTGAVSSMTLFYGGAYNNPSANSGDGNPPSGLQAMGRTTTDGRTTAGSGWQVTLDAFSEAFDSTDYYGGSGFGARAMNNAGIPYVQITRAGDKVSYWVSRDYARMAIIQATGCSSVIDEFGINDMNSGATAAQIEAYQLYIAGQLQGLPSVKGIYLTTLTPQTVSNDGFTTTTNQTGATGNSTVGVTYNTWVRSVPSPFSGYFDIESVTATSPSARLWVPNPSQVNYLTPEGVHMTPYGHSLAATVISNNAGILK